jgi:probable HAF family extracellular repeat protein
MITGRHVVARTALALVICSGLSDRQAVAQWVPIDVGTLGGWTFANALNNSGQVVGMTETTDFRRHAFSWTRVGGLIDLRTLGGSESVALAVNNIGQVVGWSQVAGDVETHAFLWSAQTGMIDLGTLGGSASVAYALNDAGQVVGASGTATGQSHAFSWTRTLGMIDLHGSDDGRYSSGIAVNAYGQVAGFSYAVYPADFDDRAFSWTQALGAVELSGGNMVSDAAALNKNGQVVGWMEAFPSVGNNHAFSWTASGGVVDLGTLDRTSSAALDVNVRGQVVGFAHSSIGPDRAFVWTQDSGMMNLGTLAGSAHAQAINDNAQVVGDSATVGDFGQYHAFSWAPVQGMIDLGVAGRSESGAWKVNARDQIVGYHRGRRSTTA